MYKSTTHLFVCKMKTLGFLAFQSTEICLPVSYWYSKTVEIYRYDINMKIFVTPRYLKSKLKNTIN